MDPPSGVDPLLELAIAWSLAALFGASTVHKLAALEEWPGVVRNYRLLPDALAPAVAAALLIAATLTAVALLWPATRRIGACAAAAQLLAFGAALAINLKRGRSSIDCGCFGSRLRDGIAGWMVARNAILALLALSLLLPMGTRRLTVLDIAACTGCVAALCLLYPVIAVVLRRPAPLAVESRAAAAASTAARRP
ncbi:MAG TPA: MauE/DoxX family redox-associated membrane protein [Steroidobacteraceae bacterium]|nr:MauE/DoxX family redox-associated membrane protein [Steroidobacteraceae bacterium]